MYPNLRGLWLGLVFGENIRSSTKIAPTMATLLSRFSRPRNFVTVRDSTPITLAVKKDNLSSTPASLESNCPHCLLNRAPYRLSIVLDDEPVETTIVFMPFNRAVKTANG